MNYEEAVKRSFTEDEFIELYDVLLTVKKLSAGVDGSLYFRNHLGDAVAEFWWNSLTECWMIRLVDENEDV
jgi:hypothetical protein